MKAENRKTDIIDRELWGESTIIPIFKKGDRTACGNHRGVSLTSAITRLFDSTISRRLTVARESKTREEHADFRPGRGLVNIISPLDSC